MSNSAVDDDAQGEEAPLLGVGRTGCERAAEVKGYSAGVASLCMIGVLGALALIWSVAGHALLHPPSAYEDCARAKPVCPSLGSARELSNIGSSGTSGRLWRPVRVRRFTRARRAARSAAKSGRAPPRRVLSQAEQHCEQWAVITTIFPPTQLVQQLVDLADWCTVIVGDRKAPSSEAYLGALERTDARGGGRLVYLSAAEQEQLGFRTVELLQWNHFGRKNVGFLYAIAHGAQVIYDTDDDNELLDAVSLSSWARAMRAEGAARTHLRSWRACAPILNPYPYFASAREEDSSPQFLWPRGFPLESLRDCSTMLERTTEPHSAPVPMAAIGVVQSLANHDPDVDAIYRLRHPLPVGFARRFAPAHPESALALGNATMAPFNAQATLWARGAFWGCLLPITVHGRVSDIWRGYFTQRVMRELGLQLAFAEPWVRQVRNAHTYLADFDSEQPLYLRAGALVAWLDSWAPSARAQSADAVVEELAIALYEIGIIEEADVLLLQAWLDDLRAAGYEPPPRVYAASGSDSVTESDSESDVR